MILPALIAAFLYILLALPKLGVIALNYHLGGWLQAKAILTWLIMDFLFTFSASWVIWLQMGKKHWHACIAFCTTALIATVFWTSPFIDARDYLQQQSTTTMASNSPSNSDDDKDSPRFTQAYQKYLKDLDAQDKDKQPISTEEEIRETFDTLLRALKTRDVATVTLLADQNTHDYFKQLSDMVWSADRATLEKLKPIDRFQVLVYRHILMHEDEALHQITAEQLFEQAIRQGWFYLGDNPDVRIDYIDILPGNTEASADIIVHSIIPDDRMTFYREEGIWKCDLLKLLPSQQDKLLASMHQKSLTEQDFLEDMLQRQTGQPMSPQVWQPLKELH